MGGAEGGAASAVASLTAANHMNAAGIPTKPTKPAAKKRVARKAPAKAAAPSQAA
jgi:hypothetical protein